MHFSRAPRARLPRLGSRASYPLLLHGACHREVGDNFGCRSLSCPKKNACARLWPPLGDEQYRFVVHGNKSGLQSNHAHRRDGIHEQRRCCPSFDGSFDAVVVFRTLSMFIDVCSKPTTPSSNFCHDPPGRAFVLQALLETGERPRFFCRSLLGSRSFHAPTFAGMRRRRQRRRRRLAGTRRPRRTLASSLLGVHRGAHASPSHGPSSSIWRDGWWTSSFLGTFSFGWLVGKWMDHTLV